jgi:hypothetical protein
MEGFVAPIDVRALHESARTWGAGCASRDVPNKQVRGVFILPALLQRKRDAVIALPTRYCKGRCAEERGCLRV